MSCHNSVLCHTYFKQFFGVLFFVVVPIPTTMHIQKSSNFRIWETEGNICYCLSAEIQVMCTMQALRKRHRPLYCILPITSHCMQDANGKMRIHWHENANLECFKDVMRLFACVHAIAYSMWSRCLSGTVPIYCLLPHQGMCMQADLWALIVMTITSVPTEFMTNRLNSGSIDSFFCADPGYGPSWRCDWHIYQKALCCLWHRQDVVYRST